jgi:hypothetical protein
MPMKESRVNCLLRKSIRYAFAYNIRTIKAGSHKHSHASAIKRHVQPTMPPYLITRRPVRVMGHAGRVGGGSGLCWTGSMIRLFLSLYQCTNTIMVDREPKPPRVKVNGEVYVRSWHHTPFRSVPQASLTLRLLRVIQS